MEIFYYVIYSCIQLVIMLTLNLVICHLHSLYTLFTSNTISGLNHERCSCESCFTDIIATRDTLLISIGDYFFRISVIPLTLLPYHCLFR